LWTIGPQGFVYVDRDASGPKLVWRIKRFDPQSRSISTLATFPRGPNLDAPAITVSPDGRSLVYTQVEESRPSIMLLENFR